MTTQASGGLVRLSLLALVLSGGVGLVLLWRSRPEHAPPPLSAAAPRSEARPSRIGADGLVQPQLEATVLPAAVPSGMPGEPATLASAEHKSSEQTAFELQQAFEAASSPDARALSVRTAMNDELEHAMASDSRLEMVECRKTICRAVLAFPSVDKSNTALQKVMRNMDGPFGTFAMSVTYEHAPDGSLKTTLFLSLG